MAAVSDPPVDVLVSQPLNMMMFASRRAELRLVYEPEYPRFAPNGRRTGVVDGGLRVKFTDGQLRVPLEGDVVTENGKRIPAKDVLEFLKRHHLNGDQHEGFFEVAQVAPPVSDEEMERVSDAAVRHDVAVLSSMLETERAGWARPGLVANIEKRLAQIEQMAADYAAQIEAQTAEDDKPAPKRAAK